MPFIGSTNMKLILSILFGALIASSAIAHEECDVEYKTEYDNSTVEAQYRTKIIELITLMIKMEDKLTGDETYQVFKQAIYILQQSPDNEERLIVLEDFVRKNLKRYKH